MHPNSALWCGTAGVGFQPVLPEVVGGGQGRAGLALVHRQERRLPPVPLLEPRSDGGVAGVGRLGPGGDGHEPETNPGIRCAESQGLHKMAQRRHLTA